MGSFHGMAATAELKALLNLVLPMQQSFAAFSLLLIPYAARLTYDSGMSQCPKTITKDCLVCLCRWRACLLAGNHHFSPSRRSSFSTAASMGTWHI